MSRHHGLPHEWFVYAELGGRDMQPKVIREFTKLVREHLRLQAEVKTLAAILDTAVYVHQPPIDWLEALKLARETEAYRNISEQYDSLLVQLEKSADLNQLDRLISTIPPTEFLN
jgi:hypothetical protein